MTLFCHLLNAADLTKYYIRSTREEERLNNGRMYFCELPRRMAHRNGRWPIFDGQKKVSLRLATLSLDGRSFKSHVTNVPFGCIGHMLKVVPTSSFPPMLRCPRWGMCKFFSALRRRRHKSRFASLLVTVTVWRFSRVVVPRGPFWGVTFHIITFYWFPPPR